MRRILLAAGVVGLLTLPAMAEVTAGQAGSASVNVGAARGDVIWDNIPDGYVGAELRSSQRDTWSPWRSGVADDFLCGSSNPGQPCFVTDVHWWGGWWNPGPPGNATAFEINFYADAGGMPTGAGLWDPSPTALFSYTIPMNQITVTPFGVLEEYAVGLPTGAQLVCAEKYWVEIVSVSLYPPQWGIADAGANQQMGFAHQGFPVLGTPYWTPQSSDAAFRLTGYLVPEPASLLLVGLAGLFLRRR